MNLTHERTWLDALHARYHHPAFIAPDPLETLADYDDPDDREVVGLVAASLAYGQVPVMLRAIRVVLDHLGPAPAALLAETNARAWSRRFRGFRYRFTDGSTMAALLTATARVRTAHGSLEACAAAGDEDDDLGALAGLAEALRDAAPRSLDHLVPDARRGSACKRLNLYLRWMVRRDAVDPGGWTRVTPARLIMPVDTHVLRTARERGWTARKTADLRTALEITRFLARIAPDDPLRYDFALTRPGIRATARADGAA